MSNPISVQGYKKLVDELESLKKERPIVIRAIMEAREEGDLRENAAYHASRERQGLLEARINYIEALLPQLTVIDLSELSGEKVIFGATVHLIDEDTEEEREYTLLGQEEADYSRGSISISSPVGRALLGHKVGDEVTVRVPRGVITYEILDIEFKGAAE
ncbi:MAG: transcription elongation factor GreA [Mailhella sp.]|nr:transcription elongation factor GreA [Mailhella sp.]